MGMVVRSNLMAANAQRQLSNNNNQVSKDLEKLSSGFKINRAADNAAGLAISEKMKAQIRGLETAVINAQDGISLVQVAEGALGEVHDMLGRMVELAEKSANGTMETPSGAITMTNAGTDRRALQDEMDALSLEIDRVAESTNFNNIPLLNGALAATYGAAAPAVGQLTVENDALAAAGLSQCEALNAKTAGEVRILAKTNTPVASNMRGIPIMNSTMHFATTAAAGGILEGLGFKLVGGAEDMAKVEDGTLVVTIDTSSNISTHIELANHMDNAADAMAAAAGGAADLLAVAEALKSIGISPGLGIPTAITAGTTGEIFSRAASEAFLGGTAANEITIDDGGDVTTIRLTGNSIAAGNTISTANLKLTIADETLLMGATTKTGIASYTSVSGAPSGLKGGLQLQIGDSYDTFNRMMVIIDDMHMSNLFDVSTLGSASLAAISAGGATAYTLDISSQHKAGYALEAVRGAINRVSTQRAKLGASQNRLEHTISNLEVGAENMSQANSRIRDTDMAWQMMDYTKMNVLTQAAQAMLAQANQQPQSVLQLLQ